MLVRISSSAPNGFSYVDCPRPACLWFADENDNSLPFDVDTWNVEGESLVWVSVPSLSNATTIKMKWSANAFDAPASQPASTEVWSRADYVGVWHMNEILEDSADGTHYTPDASCSGWNAYKKVEADAVPAPVATADGVTAHPTPLTGKAMNIAYGADKVDVSQGGFVVPVSKTSSTTLNGPGFTLSAIVNAQQIANNRRARVIAFGTNYMEMANMAVGSDYVYAMGARFHSKSHSKGAMNWICAASVFASPMSKIYVDGECLSGSSEGYPNLSSLALSKGIGLGAFTDGRETLDGYIDEARIRNAASTAEWIAAEYATVTDGSYVSFGEVDGFGGIAPPMFSPPSGTAFEDSLSVTVSCIDEGVTMHCTTDGSDPTVESPVCQQLVINRKTTVKAIAEKDGVVSEVAVAEYAPGHSVEPTFSFVAAGDPPRPAQLVSIQWENSGVVRYTMDGSDPTEGSPAYEGPFAFEGIGVLKFKGFSDDLFDSAVVTARIGHVSRDGVSRLARLVEMPVVVDSLVYNGEWQKGVLYGGECAALCTFAEGSVTSATNAGTYGYTVSLNDPENMSWDDGSSETIHRTWSIAPVVVARPIAKQNLVYDGTDQKAFASLDLSRYELAAGVTNAVSGGTYGFTFALLGNNEAVNYVWDDDSASSNPYSGSWTIAAAANEITSLSQMDCRIGVAPQRPSIRALHGAETAVFSYGFGETPEEVGEWIDDPANVDHAGRWVVKAEVPATASWGAASKTATFDVRNDPAMNCHDQVEVHVAARVGATETLVGFPVLVRISETRLLGFSYAATGRDGKELAFLDADGNFLPYDVDTWDTSGESLLWVKLATLPPVGTTISMYWNGREGMTPPSSYSPKDAWSDYVGVWHMSETTPGSVSITDASGHQNGTGHGSSLVSNGVFGKARGRNVTGDKGPAATVPVYGELDALVNGAFTVSGWVNPSEARADWAYLFARKNSDRYNGWGASFSGINFDRIRFFCSGGANYYTFPGYYSNITNYFSIGSWTRYDIVHGGTYIALYLNGVLIEKKTSSILPAVSGSEPFTIGGMNHESTASGLPNYTTSTFNGYSDEVRLRPSAISGDWIAAEYELATNDTFVTYGIVRRDGLRLNAWAELPEMDKTAWDVSEVAGVVANMPTLLYGDVTNIIYSVYDPTQTFESTADITEAGLYRIRFLSTETEDVTPIDYSIDIRVTERKPYTKIGGTNGDSGRVLLMNRDANVNCPIDRQGYSDTSSAQSTFWQHFNADETDLPFNLQPGTTSMLWTKGYGKKLWHLVDCRHGNTYPAGSTTGNLSSNQNFLPYSSTSRSCLSRLKMANQSTAGQIVMRNMVGAAVYSPCYTNGVGTIYFDAVNGWCRSTEDYENYKITVEISTTTIYGLTPTDANCAVCETNLVDGLEVITTNWYGNLDDGCWLPVSILSFKRDGTADFKKCAATNELTLNVQNGGTMDNFFRVVVPLDITSPVRFRIRRVTCVPNSIFTADESGFILLDNIIASPPAMGADLVSAGCYDECKVGTQTLGWELATSVPYPAKGDKGVCGRAKPQFYVNDGDGTTTWNTNDFFQSATMHYRWRYLNQTLDQPVSAWKDIALNPHDDFKAVATLELPNCPGDVEYWFEYSLQAPYYKYVDYSGARDAEIDYTEERGVVTNRLAAFGLPSGGTDWFFRLREGKSDYSGLDIVLKRSEDATVERVHMALVGNRLWRGFVQTRSGVAGTLKYRIEAMDRQTGEFAEYMPSTNCWRCMNVHSTLPARDFLEDCADDGWQTFVVDDAAGYVMLQVGEEGKSIVVAHAEYQDFNNWTDAYGRKDSMGRAVFAAESSDSPTKQTFYEGFSDWGDMSATNELWTFPAGLSDINPTHMYGRQAYEPFWRDNNGVWEVGNGMWVAKRYRDDRNGAGVALQLEGQGRGFLQFTDAANAPRGIESISFNARLGQVVRFDDFTYYNGYNCFSLSNYTFISRAAYDLDGNMFMGNASLSLAANYQQNKGCYEARWEWVNEPNNRKRGGQRLCLYRWKVSDEGKEATLLTAWTNGVNNANAAFEMAAPTALNETQTFMPFYITVSNDTANACTWVAAGVCATKQNLSSNTFPTGNNWDIVACRDNSADRLKCGTFGVLSANSKGFFGSPQYSPNVVFSGADELRLAAGKAGYYTQKARTAPAELVLLTAGFGTDDTDWRILPGCMTTTNVTSDACGIVAVPMPQRLSIYHGTPGRADWGAEPYTNVTVSGFAGGSYNIPIYATEDCSVCIAADGIENGVRTDVVVDSVEMRQWRGGNWDDDDVSMCLPPWADYSHRNDLNSFSNFVFTSCWITNHTVLMSAKRSDQTTPCAIRSPLMDGFIRDGLGGDGSCRGKGLGTIFVAYANAQENAVLSLQIATNSTDWTRIGQYDKSYSSVCWTTVTNFDFSAMTAAEREIGILNCYLGLRDVKGAMRIMVPASAINDVAGEIDTSRFGEVTITSIVCRDEPAVDVRSWWGWNMRTVGGYEDAERMMLLDDFSTVPGGAGLSLALNNSVDEDYDKSRIDVRDRESYIQHKPFVQTPTFASNIVAEVSFKARKYTSTDPHATVTMYGSRNASANDDGTWERIPGAVFMVTNDWYEMYTYKTDLGQGYKAFRLAVAGVEGIVEGMSGGGNGLPDGAYDPPSRVLLDEICVNEAIPDVEVDVPDVGDVVYSGGDCVPFDFAGCYEYVSGVTNATAVGEYSFVVRLKDGFVWRGGIVGDQTVTWRIVSGEPSCDVSIVAECADTTVVADNEYMTAKTSLSIYLSQAVTNDVTVTLKTTFTDDLEMTNWWDYVRFSTNDSTIFLPPPEEPSFVIRAGSTEPYVIYVYALRGDSHTIGTGRQLLFTPSVSGAEKVVAGIESEISVGLYISAAKPVITEPNSTTPAYTPTAGESQQVIIAVSDTYADMTDTNIGYTVMYNVGSGWKTLPDKFKASGEGGELVGLTNNLPPTIEFPTAGDITGQIKVTAPISQKTSETVQFPVRVAPAKTTSATSLDPDPDNYIEGDVVRFRMALSAQNDTGKPIYAFLLCNEEVDLSLFGGTAAKAILTNADVAVSSSVGRQISTVGTYVDSSFTVLDGLSEDDAGQNYTFSVVLCSKRNYDPNFRLPGYDTTEMLNITVYNKEPRFTTVSLNGFEATEDGYLFPSEYPMGQNQTILPEFDDVSYDLKHGFEYKWTAICNGQPFANGTVAHSTTGATSTVVTTNSTGVTSTYRMEIPDGMSINDAPFVYHFPYAGVWTVTIQMKDKDMVDWSEQSYSIGVQVVEPAITLVVDDSYAETDQGTIQVGLNYKPGDTVVVKLSVTPPDIPNAGALVLDSAYKTAPTGYPELADNEYYIIFDAAETVSVDIVSMDGTAHSSSRGFQVKVEAVTPEWSDIYCPATSRVYVHNVAPVVGFVTPENANAWMVASGSATSYPITWTIRGDVAPDFTNKWASGEGPGINVSFRGCQNAATFYVTDTNEWSGLFVPDFGTMLGSYAVVMTIEDKDGAIQTWTYLYEVMESPLTPDFTVEDGVLTAVELNGATEVTIPDGVTSIEASVFEGLRGLVSVTIPSSVTNIGVGAFMECGALERVVFLGDAPTCGLYAFYGCSSGCAAHVSPKSTGWGVSVGEKWNRLTLQRWPEVLTGAEDAEAVHAVLSGFADARVEANISTVEDYDALAAWVNDKNLYQPIVKESQHVWPAFLLGAERLFENEPTIEIGEAVIAGGEITGSTAVTVAVTVKDGGKAVAVDPEKVAAMFEATRDLGDWTGAALVPQVQSLGKSGDAMRFTVTPGDGSSPKAFLRIRK